jgi:hypothetical protein
LSDKQLFRRSRDVAGLDNAGEILKLAKIDSGLLQASP